jgi:LysM repeat protein
VKFKIFFILAGVVALHGIVLTGICFTGGCKSTPVLEPRPFIPAPQKQDDKLFTDKFPDDKGGIPELTIKNQPVKTAGPDAPVFKYEDKPAKSLTYTVKKNDSFWKIARKHGVSMQSLAAYNNMPLNKTLRVGQKLKIPPGGYVVKDLPPVAPRRHKTKSPKKSGSAKVKAMPLPSDGTYTVKSGDSFWKIAKRYNLKTKTLLKANNMTGKEVLQVGQKLIIPNGKNSAAAGTSAVSAAAVPKTDNSVKSILDAVDLPDDGKIDDKPKSKEAPKSVKKLIDDTGSKASIDSIDDGERAVQVIKNIKVEDFAKQYKVSPAVLKKLNDDYPADGVFKAGAVVIIRTTE